MRTSRLSLALILAATALPAQNWAIEFRGGGLLTFPHHNSMWTGLQFTAETWVKTPGLGGSGIDFCHRHAASAEDKAFSLDTDASVFFVYAGSPWANSSVHTAPNAVPFDNLWHHVAFVRHANGTYEVYVDGLTKLKGGPGPCWLTCDIIHAVTPTRCGDMLPSSTGSVQIGGLRVSNTDRYSAPFTPQPSWQPDPLTVLLFDLTANTGNIVRDRSAGAQVGTLTGNYTWVPRGNYPPGFTPIGTGCAGANGIPTLTCPGLPRVGASTTLALANLPKSAPHLGQLYFGVSDKLWGTQPLPWDLSVLAMPGCKLYVSLDLPVSFSTGTTGSTQLWFPVPYDPYLLGQSLFVQADIFDPAANLLGVSMSNAGKLTLGL